MKMLMATGLCLGLAFIASRSLSRPPALQQGYAYRVPFLGSDIGKTVERACANCHSNDTNWPWYSHVPPVSWWIHKHVRDGREKLNFSEWTSYSGRQQHDALESICGVISTERMPPTSYVMMHPEARLTAQDKMALCFWSAKEIAHQDGPR
jgi:Haem-binding domain